jgi:hypothetical protein
MYTFIDSKTTTVNIRGSVRALVWRLGVVACSCNPCCLEARCRGWFGAESTHTQGQRWWRDRRRSTPSLGPISGPWVWLVGSDERQSGYKPSLRNRQAASCVEPVSHRARQLELSSSVSDRHLFFFCITLLELSFYIPLSHFNIINVHENSVLLHGENV